MTIDFYHMPGSMPCRAVLFTAKALNLDLNCHKVDLMKGEHLTPEFLKINPQHTIPTLIDDGFALSESRAIISYLANKYGKGTDLYPEEPRARALVDQRLYFDIGTLYQRFSEYFYPQVLTGAPADKDKLAKLEDAMKVLDTFLEGLKYAAGSNLTIADLSLVASVSAFQVIDMDIKKYPNVQRWFETMKTTVSGYQEGIQEDMEAVKEMVKNLGKK